MTAYLEAENAYADAVMKPTVEFQEALYKEMLARIKEDDQSVPYVYGGWLYYSRTETGKQYSIHCRKRTAEAVEEVTLDLNALAEGHPFLALGSYAVSDDGRWLAYSSLETGRPEVYVRGFSGTTTRWQVSAGGGIDPRWRRDARELFYVSADSWLTSVGFAGGRPSAPRSNRAPQSISSRT